MSRNLKWKFLLIIFITVAALIYLAPSVVGEMSGFLGKILPQDKIHLGLDLQGGMHLVLEVEGQKAVESYVERIKGDLKEDLKKKRIYVPRIERINGDQIHLEILGEKEKFDDFIASDYPIFEEISAESQGKYQRIILGIVKKQADYLKRYAVEQALETIRNRVDQFGVAEPDISPQGSDRILIQLPGIKDPQRAIRLIGRTALLEFKLVDEERSLQEALKGTIPDGDIILYEKQEQPETGRITKVPFLLKKKTLMTGEVLKDAQVRFDNFNQPYVGLEFDPRGAKMFDRITAKNVKKRLAIILDNNVYSAPVIQERISGGRAQITGRFTENDARDLAIVLRAGALPAPVKILENRSVGPSLGKDLIDKGLKSIIIGGILVVLFMVTYYKISGGIADVALILNLILIMGALAGLRATLTLPGIAGIILTIGMAVDANVLIFERIREELRLGKTPRAAIDGGYSRAFLTIVDANVTTLIAALVLFQFGTGPVKGFAVTLSIGIVASLFTALFVSRVIFEVLLTKHMVKRVSI
ncbi:MAG: protein translocase subunit SecD [Thermodesulfobacteriota bacterium]